MRKIFSSKTRWFVALLLAAALLFGFASCSSDSDDDDDDTTSSSSNAFPPYLPSEYENRSIAALYTLSVSDTYTEDDVAVGTAKGTVALYFFSDSDDITWLETYNMLYTYSTGETASTKIAHAAGTFKISGTYTNGTITVTRTKREDDGILVSSGDYRDYEKTLTIKDGILTRTNKDGDTDSYTKQ